MHTQNKTQIRSPHPPQAVPLLRWRRLTVTPFVGVIVENSGENHEFYIPNRVLSHGDANPCLLQRRRGTTAVVDEENTVPTNKGRAC